MVLYFSLTDICIKFLVRQILFPCPLIAGLGRTFYFTGFSTIGFGSSFNNAFTIIILSLTCDPLCPGTMIIRKSSCRSYGSLVKRVVLFLFGQHRGLCHSIQEFKLDLEYVKAELGIMQLMYIRQGMAVELLDVSQYWNILVQLTSTRAYSWYSQEVG